MKDRDESREEFHKRISSKEQRKMRARTSEESVWFGLGTMGTVGWSVAVPALAGAAIGRWLDARFQDTISWTLMLLLIGVGLGSLNAYYWVRRQREHAHGKPEDDE